MKWPKRVEYRKKVLATIYRKSEGYPFYRVVYHLDGKRRMKSFATYAGEKGAKQWADALVKDIAQGSRIAALTPRQANDALAALERLQRYFEATGRRITLFGVASEYAESMGKLNGCAMGEAIDGFLSSVATVKRKDLAQAIDDFIEDRKRRTLAREGRRPQLSPEHHYNTSRWLLEFAKTFPGHAVCDLTKEHLNQYMGSHAEAAPKTRNERRGVVKMFVKWCAEKDYISQTHRLFEASELRHEPADPEDIECYTAAELRSMLERASKQPTTGEDGAREQDFRNLVPVLALAGLAGIREKEIIRLTWEDLFRIPDHVEVKAFKSKTRSRRLVQMCPALAGWLEPYRGRTGSVWPKGYDMLHEDFADLREALKIAARRNGLRHSFVSAHFAAHSDEGLTAAQAGNSPAMVHKNYKGLMTKKEGETWFAVVPSAGAVNLIRLPAVPA